MAVDLQKGGCGEVPDAWSNQEKGTVREGSQTQQPSLVLTCQHCLAMPGTPSFFLRPLLAFVKRSDSSEAWSQQTACDAASASILGQAFLAVTLGTVLLSSSLTQAMQLRKHLMQHLGGS